MAGRAFFEQRRKLIVARDHQHRIDIGDDRIALEPGQARIQWHRDDARANGAEHDIHVRRRTGHSEHDAISGHDSGRGQGAGCSLLTDQAGRGGVYLDLTHGRSGLQTAVTARHTSRGAA